ncbi:MAG: zf-TFIIB domain-containing protein [Acidobacteria bacterium]|nr:zf-TFIIB domain-containing protein [Acidobacteriota bacterium]
MNCPTCKVELKIADRQGVEIDYCPQCRGVWLDRGELDKIIERSAQAGGPDRETQERYQNEEYRQPYHGKKKKSFLGDMFDFD